MGIIDQKSKIFGNIAAARTVVEGLPKLVTNSSFPSINNNGNSIAFLTDLLKSLVGMEKLREVIIDTLSYKLDEMEIGIKTAMKQSLKELVNCGVDPSIPTYIKSGGSGIKIEVKKIDFFDVLKTNPLSPEGKLLYSDVVNPFTSSNDFNTFLYGAVQNDGVTETWGLSPILDVKFDSLNLIPTPNNTLTFNANSAYNSKTLTDFNNNYIDSVDLFDSAGLLNKILDNVFGCISVGLNKSSTQLKKEEEIKMIIDCIVNADENDVIDDNYFTFSNEEIAIQEDAANWRKKGISICHTCGLKATSLPLNTISAINLQISGATTGEAKKDAIGSGINTLGQTIKNQANDIKDAYALELNFIEKLIQNLVSSIISFILSPKIITIFLINYKIIYGQGAEYEDAADFMKKNKNLMKSISKSVRNAIISILLNTVLKQISSLVAATAIEIATEKAKNQLSQILSLVGIPQSVLRLIKGI